VKDGDVRFTVLTPRMLRLEWVPGGRFEDNASLVFLNRRLSVPRFAVEHEDGWMIIRTDSLMLRYKEQSGRFTEHNLSITRGHGVKINPTVWHPGLKDSTNLRGTIRTLDGVRGATDLEPGLLSRTGWTVVDDSERPLFDNGDWPWVRPRSEGERQDLSSGYGQEQGLLGDFVKIAAALTPPRRFRHCVAVLAYTDASSRTRVRLHHVLGCFCGRYGLHRR
jgi:hypothetical protein